MWVYLRSMLGRCNAELVCVFVPHTILVDKQRPVIPVAVHYVTAVWLVALCHPLSEQVITLKGLFILDTRACHYICYFRTSHTFPLFIPKFSAILLSLVPDHLLIPIFIKNSHSASPSIV